MTSPIIHNTWYFTCTFLAETLNRVKRCADDPRESDRAKLKAAFYVRQDVPTCPVPRCQHNALLRQAPRLLQTLVVTGKCPGYRAQSDRPT